MPMDATLQLILNEQKRIGTAVESLNLSVHAFNVENAKIPEKVRSVLADEMPKCPAFQYFNRHKGGDGLVETTHEVSLHTEQINALREKNSKLQSEVERLQRQKASVPPRDRAPWWAPSFAKIITLIVAVVGSAGAIGAWGFHCSSVKNQQVDTARGGNTEIVSADKSDR